MSEKNTLRARLVNKHDIEANWLKATNFTPLQGELIVYDVDENYNYERIKMGDGVTNVNELPFISPQADWNQNDENAPDYVKNRTHYDNVLAQVVYDGDYSPPLVNEPGSNGIYGMDRIISYAFVSDAEMPFDGPFTTDGDKEVGDSVIEVRSQKGLRVRGIGEITVDRVWAYMTEAGETNENLKPLYSMPVWIVVPHEGFQSDTLLFGTRLMVKITKPGVYVVAGMAGADIAATTLTCGETVPLDEKYIPDTIARKSDIPDAVIIDPTLTIEGAAADAKIVGDLWRAYPTDADVWELLINIGLYERIADENGNVLTDEADAILLI